MKAMSYLFIAVLCFLLAFGIFFTRDRVALWIKYAFLFIGVVGVACGTLGFALEYYRRTLVYSTRAYMDHYRTLLGGVAMGALVVLGIYGLAARASKQHDRSNPPLQPTAGRRNESLKDEL